MLLKLRRLPNPLLLKRWLKLLRLLRNLSQLPIALKLVILNKVKDPVKFLPSQTAQLLQTVQ